MAEVFPLERIPSPVQKIAACLRANGHETWYVGGAIRDVLMEGLRPGPARRVGDFDIATAALPDVVRGLFRRTVPIGAEHGTVAVVDRRGVAHEVTTLRRDVTTDGRHAEVEFGVSLEDDLARRDFTMNSIAVHPQTGEIRDPFDGRADIAAGVLRAVGDPGRRFLEDRLRILRALRFAATFGLKIEPATWKALSAQAGDIGHLSRERVRDEWLKMLEGGTPSLGVGLWRRARVLEQVWPEMAHLPDAADGRLDVVEPQDPVLLTAAALWHARALPDVAEAAVRRLRFANRDCARLRAVVAGLSAPLPAPAQLAHVRRWLSQHRKAARDIVAVSEPRTRRGDFLAAIEAIEASGDPLSVRELAVSGEDLEAAGIQPGKAMGAILRRLLDDVLEEPWRNTPAQLVARAKELAS